MNKLLGFYELRESALPAIQWREYSDETILDNNKLWTIRSAVYRGSDLNLPRKVGCSGTEGMKFALDLKRKMGEGYSNLLSIFYSSKEWNIKCVSR